MKLFFEPLGFAKELLLVGGTAAFSADMGRAADQSFVGREIVLQQLLHFAQRSGHFESYSDSRSLRQK